MRTTLLAACCAAILLSSPHVSAVTCYLVVDRNDNVVYQDIYPPVDLSDAGAAERTAMRARNEHMIAMETDRCVPLEFVGGGGTGPRINLENMGEPVLGAAKPATNASAPPSAKRSGASTPPPKPAQSGGPPKVTKGAS